MKIRSRRFPRLRRYGRVRFTFFLYMLAAVSLAAVVISAVEVRIKPLVYEYAYNHTLNIALGTLNQAVSEVLKEEDTAYSDLVNLVMDNNGTVTALVSNTIAVNDLKSRIISSVIAKFDELHNIKIKVPLGQIIGSALLLGFGPEFHVSVTPVGSIKVNFTSDFGSAGINQTLHKIYLDILADVTIIIPGKSIDSQIVDRVDVAETVIVGVVPDSYTNVADGADDEMTDKIFNFTDAG